MMKSIHTGMAIMLALLSTATWAGWTKIVVRDTKALYVDRSTITKKGHVATMWYLQDNSRPVSAPGVTPYHSSEDQSEYDCKEARQRTLFFTNHSDRMGTGQVTYASATPGDWTPILKGSLLEEAWKIACGRPGVGKELSSPKASPRPG